MIAQLVSPRCRLREFSERDLPAFADYRADPLVSRFQNWSSYSLGDARRLYETLTNTPFGKAGTWYQVAITDIQDDSLLGDCALHFIEDGQQVEIGFTLATKHQGKGLAREAVSLLLDHIFMRMSKHRVFAVTDAENHPARRLLMGLGFRQEAHFLKNLLFKGAWSDECLFACLASEWRLDR